MDSELFIWIKKGLFELSEAFNAKKYFINGFKYYIKNDNKSLSKIFMPSIRELLIDYIEIHEDINTNLQLDKLSNARNEHLEAMVYYIKSNILFEDSPYSKELGLLVFQLENKKENLLYYSQVFTLCNSLIKKIDRANIYSQIVEQVKKYTRFNQVEKAIHFIINELLYDGYSLKYLNSWYNSNLGRTNIAEPNINNVLNMFAQLKQEDEKFIYYINVLENKYFIENKLNIDFNLTLSKIEEEGLKSVVNKTFLQNAKGYNICNIEIQAKDYYKGLDNIINSINSYFQMINYVSLSDMKLFMDRIICAKPDGTFENIRIKEDQISHDAEILFDNTENREIQDVEDFIRYRGKVFTENINSQEVFNIQRALNIIKSQITQSQENKIINLWAVLEYLLTFKESGGSIISKVKDIVPKVVSLYFLKDKINVFWSHIYEQKNRDIPIINEFLQCKKRDDNYQYDLNKLIQFISHKGKSLISDLEFSAILSKEIAEIGLFLEKPKDLAKQIELRNKEINYDLVRIYRARNMLIHSGRETKTDLNCKALRLYKYNNNLIGLIIYYMCENPHYRITEILNSIDYTYENYLNELKESSISKNEIVKPKYLFIS